MVHCTAWGKGEQAVLDYLARYVFRVAITNSRIVGLDDQAVTIRHKHRTSNRWRTIRIPGHEFMRRFLQHVLPKGLHKVRYFGLWHPAKREQAPGFVCCSNSTDPPRRPRPRSMTIGPMGVRNPTNRRCVPVASRGTWSLSAGFLPSRPAHHDAAYDPAHHSNASFVVSGIKSA